jgi:hypothetical protein
MFFSLPLDAGSKFPQSVQKIKDPIAAILPQLESLDELRLRKSGNLEVIAQSVSLRSSHGTKISGSALPAASQRLGARRVDPSAQTTVRSRPSFT